MPNFQAAQRGLSTGYFKSTEQTGTGSGQNIAHGLGLVPDLVWVTVSDDSPATAGVFVMTEGTHTATNVVVTVTANKKFFVFAIKFYEGRVK